MRQGVFSDDHSDKRSNVQTTKRRNIRGISNVEKNTIIIPDCEFHVAKNLAGKIPCEKGWKRLIKF